VPPSGALPSKAVQGAVRPVGMSDESMGESAHTPAPREESERRDFAKKPGWPLMPPQRLIKETRKSAAETGRASVEGGPEDG